MFFLEKKVRGAHRMVRYLAYFEKFSDDVEIFFGIRDIKKEQGSGAGSVLAVNGAVVEQFSEESGGKTH